MSETVDVEFRRVTKAFGDVRAVDAVDLQVQKGEFLSLLGPSGCGKTTSLRMIAGFEQPTSGEVLIGGVDATGIPPWKRDVNTVFQQYALFPHLSVLDNVSYGLRQRGVSRGERDRLAREALELVQLRGLEARDRASSPAASSSAWRWRAPSSCAPGCCCSTSRSARST